MNDTTNRPQNKKQESWRGVIITALVCGLFMWWWMTRQSLPPEVGATGLVERAQTELGDADSRPPLAFEFDLLELSMLQLRMADAHNAETLAEKIQHPVLQAKAMSEIVQVYAGKESGSMSPAFAFCEKIRDPELREAARLELLLRLTRNGFPDIALENARDLTIRASILRVLSEIAEERDRAKSLIPELEGAISSLREAQQLEARKQMAFAQVQLGNREAALAIAPQLDHETRQDLYTDIYRSLPLQPPDEARAFIATLPAEDAFPLKMEAAKFNPEIASKEEVLTKLEKDVPLAAAGEARAAAWLRLAQAQWQLAPDSWKASASSALKEATSATGTMSATTFQGLAGLYRDALELDACRACLESGQTIARKIEDPAQRARILAGLAKEAHDASEQGIASELLRELRPLLANSQIEIKTVVSAAAFFFKAGEWTTAFEIMDEQTSDDRKNAIMQELANALAESCAAPGLATARDNTYHQIREVAFSQGEAEAAKLAVRAPKGLQRARAWLEIAKALVERTGALQPPPPPPATTDEN